MSVRKPLRWTTLVAPLALGVSAFAGPTCKLTLLAPQASSSEVIDVNHRGDVLGRYRNADGVIHHVIWHADGSLKQALDGLLPTTTCSTTGQRLVGAPTALSHDGAIAGTYMCWSYGQPDLPGTPPYYWRRAADGTVQDFSDALPVYPALAYIEPRWMSKDGAIGGSAWSATTMMMYEMGFGRRLSDEGAQNSTTYLLKTTSANNRHAESLNSVCRTDGRLVTTTHCHSELLLRTRDGAFAPTRIMQSPVDGMAIRATSLSNSGLVVGSLHDTYYSVFGDPQVTDAAFVYDARSDRFLTGLSSPDNSTDFQATTISPNGLWAGVNRLVVGVSTATLVPMVATGMGAPVVAAPPRSRWSKVIMVTDQGAVVGNNGTYGNEHSNHTFVRSQAGHFTNLQKLLPGLGGFYDRSLRVDGQGRILGTAMLEKPEGLLVRTAISLNCADGR